MKILLAAVLGAFVAPAFAADVGVSISVGQPGFYGQINIGDAPPPQLVYSQPVVVQPAPQFVAAAPIYLHVRPGDERYWREHCAEYDACGRPVYFVTDEWYTEQYAPRYSHADEDEDHDEDEDGYQRERGSPGLSASIGQPGFYGQIIIGGFAPQLIYPQPIVVLPSPEPVSAAPIYLHVPPGNEKHWDKHCGQYNACGRRVYFVSDDWYNNEYVPRYRHRDGDHGRGRGRGHDNDREHGRHDD